MEKAYPVCLDLNHKPCLVTGGGEVALRKVKTLLEYGAVVSVVTMEARSELCLLAEENKISLTIRAYEDGDEAGCFLVYAATGDTNVNRRIAENCRRQNIWLNAVDDPPNCDFYVPAQINHGPLSVAVSTAGRSPVLAAHIKDIISRYITEEYGTLAVLLGEIRTEVNASASGMEEKKAFYESLLSEDLISMLKEQGENKVRERIKTCISSWSA